MLYGSLSPMREAELPGGGSAFLERTKEHDVEHAQMFQRPFSHMRISPTALESPPAPQSVTAEKRP